MTRKRLGVGLAESVTGAPAGPEPKQQEQGRRRRGGAGNGAQAPAQRATATHAITDDMKNALAQIAGATIAPSRPLHDTVHEAAAGRAPEPPSSEPERPPAEQPAAEAPAAPIIDLPEPHREPTAPRVPKEIAVDLLDSVLEALPAPRRPGEGRRRSRRVSTPALTPGQDE